MGGEGGSSAAAMASGKSFSRRSIDFAHQSVLNASNGEYLRGALVQ
jgi:hypothetical protein